MKILKITFIINCCIAFILFAGHLSAQNTSLKFYDVQTGLSIVPEEVKLYDANSQELKSSFKKKSLVRGEAIELDLKKGNYNIAISKSGYKTMNVDFAASEDKRINRKMMLSPKKLPKEVTAKYLRSLHRPDRTMITGYVADDKGMPVADALLESDDGATARTNKKGYFQLSLSYDKEESHDVQLKAFNITKPGFKTERREQVVVMPNGDALYRIQLERGSGELVKQMNDFITENGGIIGRLRDELPILEDELPESVKKSLKSGSECLPQFITVGYLDEADNTVYCCPFQNNPIACEATVTLDLEEYTRRVIKHEWFSGWSSLNNIDEAYKAGAIAVRTFGAFRVYNPRVGPHDITDSPCDQVYTSGTTSWSINAADATEGVILKVNGAILKAEYSAENNNLAGFSCVENKTVGAAGCGDGFAKDGFGGCIEDPLGAGLIQYGHGRNMSQFGSARWASGLLLGFWCGNDASNVRGHSHGPLSGETPKTWEQIINRYYPSHDLVYCNGNGPTEEECPTDLTVSDYQSTNIQAANTIDCSATIANSDDVKCHAGTLVTLSDGFHAEAGSTFHAYIAGCDTEQDDCEILSNSNFDLDSGDWTIHGGATTAYNGNTVNIDITTPGADSWNVILRQINITLEANKTYNFSMRAKADNDRTALFKAFVPQPYYTYIEETVNLTTEMDDFDFSFTMPGTGTTAAFMELLLGGNANDVEVDFISITEQGCTPPPPTTCELLTNGSFDNGSSDWTLFGGTNLSTTTGVAALTGLYVGTNAWDINFTQGNVNIEAGKTYTLTFDARGSSYRPIQVKLIRLDNFATYFWNTVNLTTNMSTHEITFEADATYSGARLDFMLASDNADVYLDDVSLTTACNNKEETSLAPDIQLYPNPATNTINVKYELSQNTSANIAVFDAFGKLVKSVSNVELLAGEQTLDMNVSDLAAGMYFYTLQANEWKATKKFIIVK